MKLKTLIDNEIATEQENQEFEDKFEKHIDKDICMCDPDGNPCDRCKIEERLK
ncbi:hypothetical protein LCGC14_2372730 [marine sediment metagenome]|uniref:Uncharacterized protein n=1 Tax=marine sediment metagenome TaxID=412755 RepID=A0A0F9CQI5_9ZZZZ